MVEHDGVQAYPHHRGRVILILWQLIAMAGQVSAIHLARLGHEKPADVLSTVCMGVMYGSAVWVLTRPKLSRTSRNMAIACLAVTPTLMSRANDPLIFTGFDEQLHMRTLADIIASHRLFEPNPVLEISPRYPGLETVTVVLSEFGLPPMVAALAVILIARLILVFVLSDAVELLTESSRAGGLAVAVYALSPQFVWFNSQFSYQTVSLPLALGAISMIGRARHSENPLPLFGGATVCLLGVALTHHLTSFLTVAFLCVWTLAEHGQARLRVAYGAMAALAATVLWAIVQRSSLTQYFGPMLDDLISELSGGVRRQAFHDSSGTATPLMDKILLLTYAGALTLTVMALFFLTLRWQRRREHDLHYWNPQLLVLGLSLAIPILLAARVVPKGVEIFTRSSSFLFLPLSFVVVNYMGRLDWWHMGRLPHRPPQEFGPEPKRRRDLLWHVVATVLASVVFLGGYVLGSGPAWMRLPGSYMPAADSRSMDPETLAAVRWADESLPPGSRIGADRVSAVLLASEAQLWPVYEGLNGVKTPDLYVPYQWGPEQSDAANALKIRYLYVDRRMADSLPPFGIYFNTGEAGQGKQLTPAQLTKFDRVPGIKMVYRHGPVSIYDLKGLGLTEYRNGWVGSTPVLRPVDQVAIGLVVGLFIAWVMGSRFWPRILAQARGMWRACGPADGAAVLLAATGLVSAALLLLHVWLTPLLLISGLGVPMLVFPHRTAAMLRRATSRVTRRGVLVTGALLIPLAAIIGFAVYDAAAEDVVEVRHILEDPQAVHIPPDTQRG
ncbi:MAG: hypothetical protein KIH64_011525 [Mycobacterium sp.]|nr:hypothetical protein [Mycobacterium sp.]